MSPTWHSEQEGKPPSTLSAGNVVELAEDYGGASYVVLEVLNTLDGFAARLWRLPPLPCLMPSLVLTEKLRKVDVKFDEPLRSVLRLVVDECLRPWTARTCAAFTARADFKPFQFRPLLKFQGEGAKHVLIADETGLGKTIEAGYIIAEEIARFQASRVLVLCPSRLRRKWYAELWGRFGLPFRIVGAKGLLSLLRQGSGPLLVISSIDGGRSIEMDEIESITENPLIDILVIDEVHRMIGRGGDTIRRQYGLELAQRSQAVVALSATPVQIEVEDLKRVMDLVAPGEFDLVDFASDLSATTAVNEVLKLVAHPAPPGTDSNDLVSALRVLASAAKKLSKESYPGLEQYATSLAELGANAGVDERTCLQREAADKTVLSRSMTRTRAIDVGEDRLRRVTTLRVRLDEELSVGFQRGARVEVSEASYYTMLDSFFRKAFAHTHRMQLSSCLPTMVDLLRMGALGSSSWEAKEHDVFEDADTQENLDLNAEERTESQRLADLAGLVTTDSKWKTFADLLSSLKADGMIRKAITFTHWIPTFRYLSERLSAVRGTPVFRVSADLDDEESAREISRFQSHDGFCVLLTTDVLREGVDLDAADCVINYDIPYNPQVVEQRIGRIDRIGQKSSVVHIYNIIVSESLDDEVYTRLLSRVGVFERSVGDMRPILEEMGGRLVEGARFETGEIEKEAQRIEDTRRLMQHGVFSAVEDFLDEDIRRVHDSQVDSLVGFRWLILATFFGFLDDRINARWDSADRSLVLTGVSQEFVDALLTLTGLDAREEVSAMFRTLPAEGGSLRLNLGGGRQSLPLSHPLLRAGLGLLAGQGLSAVGSSHIAPHLKMHERPQNVPPTTTRLVMLQYEFKGEQLREMSRAWWGLSAHNAVTKLPGVASDRLLEACLSSASAAPPSSEADIAAFLDAAARDFNEWVDIRGKGEHDLRLLTTQAALRTARARLHRLEARLAAVTEGGGMLARKVSEVRQEVDALEGRLKSLQLEPWNPGLAQPALRRVALVISFGGD